MTDVGARQGRSARAVAPGWLAVALAALLVGCAGVPTSGSVQRGEPVIEEPNQIFPFGAAGPQPGDPPESIVGGFLRAQAAGFSDRFQFTVARQFLANEVRNTWDPLKESVIYARTSAPDIQLAADRTVRVSLVVAGTLSAGGQFDDASPRTSQAIDFAVEKDAGGQWRISKLAPGLILSEADFTTLYRETTLYFPSSDGQYFVPDVRWFAGRSIETQAVRALLDGPAEWLRDGVEQVVPSGVRLSSDAVTVADGVAQVDLSSGAKAATPIQRAQLKMMLSAALAAIPDIQGVRVTVGGVELSSPVLARMEEEAPPGSQPWGIAGGNLVRLEGTDPALVRVPGVDLSGVDAPSDPAVGYVIGEPIVVLSGGRSLVYLPPGSAPPRELVAGDHLVPPSVDRQGWVWTAEAQSRGTITAILPSSKARHDLSAGWLDGRSVRSLRVSRDGSRLIVVSASSVGVVEVDVVAISRRSGIPIGLGKVPLRIGAALTDATAASWVDETSVAVLGRADPSGDPAVYIVPIGGLVRKLGAPADAVGLASGYGERLIYVLDSSGALFVSNKASWTLVAQGVSSLAFPG